MDNRGLVDGGDLSTKQKAISKNAGGDSASANILPPEYINEEAIDAVTDSALLHPLENTWTMWYLHNDPSKTWEEMQNEVLSVKYVEKFWSLHNHIKPPSAIRPGCDYSFFKKGIRPMWEDAANVNGGRWVMTINHICNQEVNALWTEVLLCLIGETFDHGDEVCGAVVNVRKTFNKISLWTANGSNEEAVLEIGRKLRDNIRNYRMPLLYELHTDCIKKNSMVIKPTYTL